MEREREGKEGKGKERKERRGERKGQGEAPITLLAQGSPTCKSCSDSPLMTV